MSDADVRGEHTIEIDGETFKGQVVDMVGTHRSYGKTNLITFQSKVDRELFNRYDVLRRLFNKTRRDGLEDFMRYTIDRHKSDAKGLDKHFTPEGE